MSGSAVSPLDAPECPECEGTVFVDRAGNRRGGAWFCRKCEVTFDA